MIGVTEGTIMPGRLVPKVINARSIVTEVARARGVSVSDILGRDRHQHIAWARQEAMARIRVELRWSWQRIGRMFGRDHSTAVHNFRAYGRREKGAGWIMEAGNDRA